MMIRLLSVAVFVVIYQPCHGQALDNKTADEYPTLSNRQAKKYGLLQFENTNVQNYNFQDEDINSDNPRKPIIFENDGFKENFQDPAQVGGNLLKKKRRRKPKKHPVPFTTGLINGLNQANLYMGPTDPYWNLADEYGGAHLHGLGTHQHNGVPNIATPSYRPHGPAPSLASQALAAVADALVSVARFDDYQCVPRLLCEAAGGGALGNSQLLQAVSRIQPLLTVLSAYSGTSTNPLFVFGRAVFLGLSSKENSASCRYAYPLCPTDTEELVHYLNNYNGGFFRFFSLPQQQGQQGVEQFYNQLSSYGFYNPSLGPNKYGFNQNQQTFYRPGLYPIDNQQKYGFAYPYTSKQIQFKNNFNETRIENRIQNKPNFIPDEEPMWSLSQENDAIQNEEYRKEIYFYKKFPYIRKGKRLQFPSEFDENNSNQNLDNNKYTINEYDSTHDLHYIKTEPMFKFPQDFNENESYEDFVTDNKKLISAQYIQNTYNENIKVREGMTLKFPDAINDDNTYKGIQYTRGSRGLSFPEMKNYYYNYDDMFGSKYAAKKESINEDDGLQTFYIVRGNGDPNNPEIVKLKPGEKIK